MLWFAAVRLSRPDLIESCRKLFEKLSMKKRHAEISCWPMPIGRFFLGMIDESALMDLVTQGVGLRERELCQAYFARAVSALAAGNKDGYRKFLKLAAALPSPAHIETEYFLTRHELFKLGEKCEPFS